MRSRDRMMVLLRRVRYTWPERSSDQSAMARTQAAVWRLVAGALHVAQCHSTHCHCHRHHICLQVPTNGLSLRLVYHRIPFVTLL